MPTTTKRTMPQAWQFLTSPLKNRWQVLRAASEKIAPEGDNFRFNSDLVIPPGIEPGLPG